MELRRRNVAKAVFAAMLLIPVVPSASALDSGGRRIEFSSTEIKQAIPDYVETNGRLQLDVTALLYDENHSIEQGQHVEQVIRKVDCSDSRQCFTYGGYCFVMPAYMGGVLGFALQSCPARASDYEFDEGAFVGSIQKSDCPICDRLPRYSLTNYVYHGSNTIEFSFGSENLALHRELKAYIQHKLDDLILRRR